MEFLFNDTNIIANAILQGNSLGLKVGMQQSSSASFIFEHHLFELCKSNIISQDIAQIYSSDRSTFDQMILGSYSIPTPDAMLNAR